MEDLVRIDNKPFGDLTLENYIPLGDIVPQAPTAVTEKDNSLQPFIKWGVVAIIVIIAILIVLKLRK